MEPICALKDLYKILYQFEKDFHEAHAITLNEAMLLCCLRQDDCKTAGSLSEYIGLSPSRASKVITTVESKGYITRTISAEDKRQMLFTLTRAGKEKVARMQEAELKFAALHGELTDCLRRMGSEETGKAENGETETAEKQTL